MQDNILLLTDSYKFTHWKQYPPKTEQVYSYFESRGGEFDRTVFFGLQYLLKKYLTGQVVDLLKISKAKEIVDAHLGPGYFNLDGWNHIVTQHQGRLPLRIKAVPEGSSVPTKNVLMTVENTCPECFWLTNYVETLLVQTWYPTTVATISSAIKGKILSYLEETGDPSLIDFKLHDFGFRGVSSVESAGIGGAAHLVNFKGTDTVAGLLLAKDYYNAGVCGFSIPAAEHSTITSWGKENEKEAFRNMLTQFPTGLVAVVSDSFDVFNACSQLWGRELRELVENREGALVVRPDSGDPATVVCRVLEILGTAFGYTINEKGYKVLSPKVKVIQGDGVDFWSIGSILQAMKDIGWSADNLAFGMGGALLQKLNRDTQKFAFKCSSITIDGQEKDVFKSPITDKGKQSKAGKLKLVPQLDNVTTQRLDSSDDMIDLMETVFENGELVKDQSFDEIRDRLNKESII